MNNLVIVLSNIYQKLVNLPKNIAIANKKISESEVNYLNIIYKKESINLTKFAKEAKITKPAATQLVNKYIEKGYVIKKVSSVDKRVCYLELTENIKKIFEESYKKLNEFWNSCLDVLTKEEFEELKKLLMKLDENI